MKTKLWIIEATACLAYMLLAAVMLPAQTLLTLPTTGTAGSGSTAVDFELRLDGSIYEKGSGTSTLTDSDVQSSRRFLWYSPSGALRVGGGSSAETAASLATAYYSVALGNASRAPGTNAFAMGQAGALGANSFAEGSSAIASSLYGIAMGNTVSASGPSSVAIGAFDTASNQGALATGWDSSATGVGSASFNWYSSASGSNAAAFNSYTSAAAFDSFAVGTYNLALSETGAAPSATTWVSSDPLFEVGMGTSSSAKADALVVYKDGTAKFAGAVSVPQSGDIPMYTGN